MRVLSEVRAERYSQDDKWGEQNHPDCDESYDVREEYESEAYTWKHINEARVARGTLSNDGILLEEVYEALAEIGDDAKLREELIQVAAVAVMWVEQIDRKKGVTE